MKSIIWLSIFFLLSFIEVKAQAEWRLDKEGEGIKVYSRKVKGSPFRGFRGTLNLQSNLSLVEKILDRYDKFHTWQANGEPLELVEQLSDSSKILYVHTHLPWPLSDRDAVFSQTKVFNATEQSVSFVNQSLPDRLPQNKGIIRVHRANGFWKVTQKAGFTEVVFQWDGDPGGSIPGWIANLFIVQGPFKTLSNLKKLLGE